MPEREEEENATPASPAGSAASRGRKRRGAKLFIVAALVALVAVVAGVALLVNIMERKQEARNPFYRVVELNDETEDPAVWGRNFPLQYDAYRRTVDQQRTKYGGSEAEPRTPTQADPRSFVAQSRLEEDPRLKLIWAGYAFSKDFREERGHAYMLDDQTFTERQQVTQQPGACIHCHGSVYVPYKKLGGGDLMKGFELMNQMKFGEARKLVAHPVTCLDCHDSQTMQLRVTRPGFIEGIRALAASDDAAPQMPSVERWRAAGRKGAYDVNAQATRQEMRAFVCGQCHVEYYFKGTEKRLTYPWRKGLKIEQIMAYYEEVGHKDWQHAETSAPVLKAQHPEFELWNQGLHARSGVACADCHMPYTRVGALKVSDHHVRSPLLNINNACQVCHKWPEEELRQRVETIQGRTFRMRNVAMDALIELIGDIKAARDAGRTDEELRAAREFQRKAQFYLDFVEAENSTGFHAGQEAVRILGESVNFARQGQLSLRGAAAQPARTPASNTPAAFMRAKLGQ